MLVTNADALWALGHVSSEVHQLQVPHSAVSIVAGGTGTGKHGKSLSFLLTFAVDLKLLYK